MPLRASSLLGTALLFLGSPSAAQEAATQAPPPDAKATGVDVTFLANAGFLLRAGQISILIDAFLREPTGAHGALPSEVYKQLVNAAAPYDGYTVVLVSHDHPDHVQMRGLEKFLANNQRAHFLASQSLLGALKGSAREPEAFNKRVTPIRTAPGTLTQLRLDDLTLEFLELRHAGEPFAGVQNLGHLIEVGGVRILHVGDAEPTVENFGRYDLDQRRIDVAFIPYWFLGKPSGVRVLQEEIQARQVVLCHVPPREWEDLNNLVQAHFPEMVLFREALETRHFDPAPAGTGEGD